MILYRCARVWAAFYSPSCPNIETPIFFGASQVTQQQRLCLQYRSRSSCELGFDPCIGKIPFEEEMATHSSILAGKIPMDRRAWQAAFHRVAESRHYGAHSTYDLVKKGNTWVRNTPPHKPTRGF